MFLGTTFFSGKHTLLSPTTNITNFEKTTLLNGIYAHLFLSEKPNLSIENVNDDWGYDTKLNAKFDSNLEAGNIDFSTKNTDTLVIKTREVGSLEWKTIYTVPITKDSDFNFTINYPYSRNMSSNEYMLINTMNGIEHSYVIAECSTNFDGFYIVDKDNIYGTMYNIEPTDTTQNINNSILELLNNTYPTVVTNSDVNYTTGITSGCFLKLNLDTQEVDVGSGVTYRKDIMDWLCNKKAKILKLEDGRIYLIKIHGKPTDINAGHQDLRKITFEWVEIGDVNSSKDLYINNLSDVDVKWW
jgi:hypothetical protein